MFRRAKTSKRVDRLFVFFSCFSRFSLFSETKRNHDKQINSAFSFSQFSIFLKKNSLSLFSEFLFNTLKIEEEELLYVSRMCINKETYRHLIFLIMKSMEEEDYKESLLALEKESKIFFDMNHFGETIVSGEWEMAEKYLSAFTKLDDNRYSRKLLFELRKQKYYEALCRNDHTEAFNIFWKDLKVFSIPQNRIDGELAELLH